MKMLLVLLLVGIVVMVVIRSLRNERSAVSRRRFPGHDLPSRYDGTDTSFMATGAFGSESSHHGQGHDHGQGADCAPSHDAGGSVDCGSDGGAGSSGD